MLSSSPKPPLMAIQNPTPTPEKPPSQRDGVPIFHNASIYAGDLDPEVNEQDLVDVFRFMGPIASVRLCRDSLTGKSLRYAYVNFFSYSHASKALACLNHTEVKGKPMRLMWSQRDPLVRKTGIGNVFVKNLDTSITSAQLQDIFAKFGNILSCKVAEENGASKGFGFVQFDSEESATNAINSLHDTEVHGKNLFVVKFVKKSERMTPISEELKFTNLFVRNLDVEITLDLLRDTFARFGKVSTVSIIKDEKGNSKGFGFVEFESPESAKTAASIMNGSVLGSKVLFVERARQKDGKKTFNEILRSSNLRVNNLDISVDNKQLRKHFSCCGKIVSVLVFRLKNGVSKGTGLVCFSTHEEAKKALKTLNGTVLAGKPLHLVFARGEFHCKDQSAPPVRCNAAPSTPSRALLEPLSHRYLDGNYFVQYPPMLQNFLNHYAKSFPTSQVHMGGNSNFPKQLSY